MPNPDHGCSGENGLDKIFVDNIYKNSKNPWLMTAAVNGAHMLGGAKIYNSGYDG